MDVSAIRLPWACRILLVALVLLPLGVTLSAMRVAGDGPGDIAAVFPPWWNTEHAFGAASMAGVVRGVGGLGSVMIVQTPDAASRDALRRAGAWLLLDARWAGGCRPFVRDREDLA
jgi:hypothetical protein